MTMDFELAIALLGVKPEDAGNTEVVKSAYRKISKAVHPDLHHEDAEIFTSLSTLVNQAYDFLTKNVNQGQGPTQGRPGSWTPGPGYRSPSWEDILFATQYASRQASQAGAQSASYRTKEKAQLPRLQVTFDILSWLHLNPNEKMDVMTSKGPATVGLYSLSKYEVVLVDNVEFSVSKDGKKQTSPVPIRQKRSRTGDNYTFDIRVNITDKTQFPLVFRMTRPKVYETSINGFGTMELPIKIQKDFKLTVRLNVVSAVGE